MISDILEYTFLKNAFLCALLVSITCGIIGTIVVEKNLVMMSGGIAHASFGGIGFGYWMGIEPIVGGLIFSMFSALGIVTIKRKTSTKSVVLISMFWSAGMAIGILFIAMTPGYPPDITSYLFGDILTVSKMDIILIVILDMVMVASVVILFNYWKAFLFDEEFVQSMGIKTTHLESFLFILIAFAVVVLIKVVGIILIMTLLTVPPVIARMYTFDLKKMMILSGLIGMFLSVFGLVVSYYLNIPSGATIIILTVLWYFVAQRMNKIEKVS